MSIPSAGQRIAREFFQLCILKYNLGDVQYLLEKPDAPAGTLLAVSVNGVDIMGGICYGFRNNGRDNSTERSIAFLENHMSFPHALADFLYRCVRCGIAHEGAPKVGISFFHNPSFPKGEAVYREDHPECIHLNVTEFARKYVDAVKSIEAQVDNLTLHVPPVDPRIDFATAKAIITADAQKFCIAIDEDERRRTNSTSSSSCRMPDNTFSITLKLAPLAPE